MQPLKVSHYKLKWDLRDQMGSVTLVMMGPEGPTHEIIGLKYEPYMALVDMLRNEKPVFWDAQAEVLSTGSEMVGEEEL